jgi:cytidine deaminase
MQNTNTDVLHQKAKAVLHYAYAPFSKFKVAASILTSKGNIYTGVNVENAAYGLATCAEASAISMMVTAGETDIKEVLVMCADNILCPPCGACRQRLIEFAHPDTIVTLANDTDILKQIPLQDLLPLAFTFSLK